MPLFHFNSLNALAKIWYNMMRGDLMFRSKLDTLNQHLSVLMMSLLIFNMFYTTLWVTLTIIALFLVIYFRMSSKNKQARFKENQHYKYALSKMNPKHWFKKRSKPKKEASFKYYKCKGCGQQLRVPKGRGTIVVTCPKCKMQFNSRS